MGTMHGQSVFTVGDNDRLPLIIALHTADQPHAGFGRFSGQVQPNLRISADTAAQFFVRGFGSCFYLGISV
jgi:hypothetical protein